MIIGITGSLSAGKDTVAQILEENGFRHISLSQILRELVLKKGGELTTENLTKEGNNLRQERGNGYLAKEALKQVREDTAISSIRQPGEVEVLRESGDFFLISVDADPKIRWQRLKERQRPGDPKTIEGMLAIEKKQMKSGGSKDMQLDVVWGMADYHLDNNGSLGDLQTKVREIIKAARRQIGKEKSK